MIWFVFTFFTLEKKSVLITPVESPGHRITLLADRKNLESKVKEEEWKRKFQKNESENTDDHIVSRPKEYEIESEKVEVKIKQERKF